MTGPDASRIRRYSRGDVLGVVAPLLWIATPLIAVAGYLWLILQSFSSVGCGGDCREQYVYWPLGAYPWVAAGVIVVACLAAVALHVVGRRTEWAALAAFALVLATIVSATAIREYGLAPMHERNERIASGEIPASPDMTQTRPSPVGSWGDASADAPYLEILDDGTLSGSDGCNAFAGEWMRDSDGVAIFGDLVASTEVCDGVDTWLSYGRSAYVVDGDLWIGDDVGIIGFLPPDVR